MCPSWFKPDHGLIVLSVSRSLSAAISVSYAA